MKLEEKIIEIIKGNIDSEYDVNLSTNLRDDIDIDSFDLLMIIAALEDEFCIEIERSNFEKITLVSDIVDMLNLKKAQEVSNEIY